MRLRPEPDPEGPNVAGLMALTLTIAKSSVWRRRPAAFQRGARQQPLLSELSPARGSPRHADGRNAAPTEIGP